MLDENELKFGDLLVEKGYRVLYMFLEYYPRTLSIKLLKIPSDIYIPSVPVWKPDYESFLGSHYVRDHRIFRPISYMDYADPDQIKKHNDKANHYLNLGNWLYNCSLCPIEKINLNFKNYVHLDTDSAKQDAETFFKTACLIQGRSCGKTAFAAYRMNKYLEDHPDAIIVMPRRNGYSYYIDKELINSIYGYRDKHDDMLDAISYAIKEFERKQREEEKNKMADKKEVYTFTTKDFKGNRYEITLEKDFKNDDYPYHARTYTLKDANDRCFAVTFGYRYWEQLETQLMYDLAGNGIVICKDCRDEVTHELHRAKNVFRGCSYANFDSPYQGGFTTNRPSAKVDTFFENGSLKRQIDNLHENPFEAMPKIEKVIFNPPATIVKWKDGTKTVVKCQDGDEFDWEKGLAMAYVKRAFNNERTYYGLFKKNEPDVYQLPNSNAIFDVKGLKKLTIIAPKEVDTKELNEKFIEWMNEITSKENK